MAITTVPRSTIEHTYHGDIDAILKDLRVCSRRLKLVLSNFKNELRTLERLYYKSKNQHRTALFFQRVPEIRRYGRRLSELDIMKHVDLLRASFVGLENTDNHKALRGSWSHVPEKLYVHLLMERLTTCNLLVYKMRERLEKAYHQFVLAMQTGAFAQLIILFVAISCRMSVLSTQLEEALRLGVSTCSRLLVAIRPAGGLALISQQPTPASDVSHPSSIDRDLSSELTRTSALVVKDQNTNTEATSEMQVTHPPANADTAWTPTVKAVQKPQLKKAKKRMDEIDEIFGL